MIYFQSSLPRSGSTLLQNILHENPRFHATPTSGLSRLLVGAREEFRLDEAFKGGDWQESQREFLGFCRGALNGFYSHVERPVVIDKSREWLAHYEWLEAFLEHPKLICMVRDPRAIVASLEKLYRRRMFMGDEHNYPHIDQRVADYLNGPLLGLQLLRLKDALNRGLEGKIHFVKFEDFTENPAIELDKIYDYLGEPRYNHDVGNVQQRIQEHDAAYWMYGDHQIHEGPIQSIPDDFRKVLGDGNCCFIADSNLQLFEKFGYNMRF